MQNQIPDVDLELRRLPGDNAIYASFFDVEFPLAPVISRDNDLVNNSMQAPEFYTDEIVEIYANIAHGGEQAGGRPRTVKLVKEQRYGYFNAVGNTLRENRLELRRAAVTRLKREQMFHQQFQFLKTRDYELPRRDTVGPENDQVNNVPRAPELQTIIMDAINLCQEMSFQQQTDYKEVRRINPSIAKLIVVMSESEGAMYCKTLGQEFTDQKDAQRIALKLILQECIVRGALLIVPSKFNVAFKFGKNKDYVPQYPGFQYHDSRFVMQRKVFMTADDVTIHVPIEKDKNIVPPMDIPQVGMPEHPATSSTIEGITVGPAMISSSLLAHLRTGINNVRVAINEEGSTLTCESRPTIYTPSKKN
jgi:hypothetical protein